MEARSQRDRTKARTVVGAACSWVTYASPLPWVIPARAESSTN